MRQNRIYTILSKKLSGEINSFELAELNDLIEMSPNHQSCIKIIEEFWNTNAKNDAAYLEASYYHHSNNLKQKGYFFQDCTCGYTQFNFDKSSLIQHKK